MSWQRGKERSIQGRLFQLLLLVLVPVLAVQGYTYYDRFNTERNQELQTNLEIARAVAKTFETFIEDVLHQEHAIGLSIASIQSLTSERITRLLERTLPGNGTVRDFSWVDLDGTYLYSSSPAMVGANCSNRSYFHEISKGREWMVGELVLEKISGKPAFAISRAIRDDKGTLLGIVVATVVPEQLDSVLSVERDKGGGVNIVDNKGMLVYRYPHLNPSWEERNWVKTVPQIQKSLNGEEMAWIGKPAYEDRLRIMANVPIISIGWAAGAGRSQEDAMAATTSRLLPQALLLLFINLAAFAVAVILSRYLSFSVRRLREHALALGNGKYHEEVRIGYVSELQEVVDSFNSMAEKVRSREAALRESEELLRLFIEHAPASLAMFDREMRYLNASLRWLSDYNLGERDLKGLSHYDVFPEIPEYWRLVHRRGLDGEVVRAEEDRFERADGSVQWLRWEVRPWRDASGKIGGIVIFTEDITENKRAEDVLLTAHKRLEAIMRAVPVGVSYSNDITCLRITGNPAVLAQFDVQPEDNLFASAADSNVPGRLVRYFRNGEEISSTELPLLRAVTEKREIPPMELEIELPGGRRWFAECSSAPIYDERGNVNGSVTVTVDITERKITEERLSRLNRSLRTLSECNQRLVRAQNEQDLLDQICQAVIEHGGYRMAWAGYAERDEARSVRPVSVAGFNAGYLDSISISWADTEQGQGPTGRAIRNGEVVVCRSTLTDPRFAIWRKEALERGYRSSISLPLKVGGQTLGALNIYSGSSDAFDLEEEALLIELANDLAYGIVALRTQAEHDRAEQLLIESESRLRALTSTAAVFIVELGRDGRILFCNRTYAGMDQEYVTGTLITDWFPEEQRAAFQELVHHVSETGEELATEYTIPNMKGEPRTYSAVLTRLPFNSRTPTVVLTATDITERKQMEDIMQGRLRLVQVAAFNSLEELLRATLDEIETITRSRIGFFHFFDADRGTLSLQTWSTRTLAEMCTAQDYGLHYDISKAGVWVDCIHERRPVIHNDYFSLPHRKGLPPGHAEIVRELVVPVFRRDRIVAILGVGNKPKNYDEKDIQAVMTLADLAWDLVEKKRSEISLRRSEERFRSLVEHSLVGILILQDDRIVYLNPEQEKITGSLLKIGERLNLEAIHPDDVDKLGALLQKLITLEEPFGEVDFRFYPSTEDYEAHDVRWCRCLASVIDYQGKDAVLLNTMDITRTMEIEHLLRIEDKMTSLGRVAAGIAHELRSPISGINIYVSNLERVCSRIDGLDFEISDKMNRILQQLRHAADNVELIVRKVMDFARPDEPSFALVDLNRVIEQTLEFTFTILRKSAVVVEKRLTPDLPLCYADRSMIGMALLNLINNAAQAMRNTTGEKVIEILTGLAEGEIIIKVSDSGPGVPKSVRKKIFDPFFSTQKGGLGIGLSICSRVIRDHGGMMNVETSRWGGAEFTIKLPMKR